MPFDERIRFEVFLSGMRRQDYEAANRRYDQRGDSHCRLCGTRPRQGLIYREQLAIIPDAMPFFPHHMLLRPTAHAAVSSPTDEGPTLSRGPVAGAHLDHRDHVLAEDLLTMARLCVDAPSYMVTQAMRGSGASIPEHIHAHAFPRAATRFPLLEDAVDTLRGSNSPCETIADPSFGVIVRADPEHTALSLAALQRALELPVNFYLWVEDDLGLVGAGIPRVAELPSGPVALAEIGWKFGAFEVAGLYDAKTEDIYWTMTAADAIEATRSVTVQDPRQQRRAIAVVADIVATGRERDACGN